MKAYKEVEVETHAFLTSALDDGVVNFTLRPLYPRCKSPLFTFDRGLTCLIAGLGAVVA
jgi:hypothetical protein